MDDYKSETKQTYDSFPKEFDAKFEDHFNKYVKAEAEYFSELVRDKRLKILDLGSGPGNHAAYFKRRGLDIICVDSSSEMVRLCKEKGLDARVMDIEQLDFQPKCFSGIWAYASLLHIPKANIQPVVSNLHKILRKNGIMAVALKEGRGEGLEADERYPGTQRWFSYYTQEEVRDLFCNNGFKQIYSGKTILEKYTFLKQFFRKK